MDHTGRTHWASALPLSHSLRLCILLFACYKHVECVCGVLYVYCKKYTLDVKGDVSKAKHLVSSKAQLGIFYTLAPCAPAGMVKVSAGSSSA